MKGEPVKKKRAPKPSRWGGGDEARKWKPKTNSGSGQIAGPAIRTGWGPIKLKIDGGQG